MPPVSRSSRSSSSSSSSSSATAQGGGGGGVSWVCVLGVVGLIIGILLLTRPVDDEPTQSEWYENAKGKVKQFLKKDEAKKPKPAAGAAAAKPKPKAKPNPAVARIIKLPGVKPVRVQQPPANVAAKKAPAAVPGKNDWSTVGMKV